MMFNGIAPQWIYGGGCISFSYDNMTTRIVQRSVDQGKPLVLVSMNYRMSAFGFLASQEVKDAGVGNIGHFPPRARCTTLGQQVHRRVRRQQLPCDPVRVPPPRPVRAE